MIRTAFTRPTPTAERKPAKGPRTVKCGAKGCMHRIVPDADKPVVKWCSIECGAAIAIAAGAARKLKLAKADRAATKVRKDATKRRADHIAEAQQSFNAFVRYRDRDELCISCDVHLPTLAGAPGGGFDCGHFRSRGSAPHLRFDERNAHGQCKRCNRYKAGNVSDYRVGLIARYGALTVEALEADQTERRYTVEELQAIKAHYRAKLKQLKETAC